MQRIKTQTILTVLIAILVFPVMAGNSNSGDNTWNWGNNEIEAKGYWMSMERLVKTKKYEEATVPLTKLLADAPELNLALYINAIKVYKKRAFAEKDVTKKRVLQDSTLALYDKRTELFGDRANVLNRKGKVAWRFLSMRKNTSEELFVLYREIYALNKNKTYPENMNSYLKAACVKHVNNTLSKEEVIHIFTNCIEVLDAQLVVTTDIKKTERINRYKNKINANFSFKVKLQCEDMDMLFAKQFKDKENMAAAKSIVSLCVSNKCVSTNAFVNAAEYMVNNGAANYSLYKLLANVYVQNNENEKASNAFAQALNSTNDSSKKATLNFELAQLSAKKGELASAREFAFSAIDNNVAFTSAYSFIGDLYFNSDNTCSLGTTVNDRAIYIAAYTMYKKAGNSQGAAQAKAQFPSKEELFLVNKKIGETVTITCWINQTVVLQTRN